MEEKMKINLIKVLNTYGCIEYDMHDQENVNPNTKLTYQADMPAPVDATSQENFVGSKRTDPAILKMLGTL